MQYAILENLKWTVECHSQDIKCWRFVLDTRPKVSVFDSMEIKLNNQISVIDLVFFVFCFFVQTQWIIRGARGTLFFSQMIFLMYYCSNIWDNNSVSLSLFKRAIFNILVPLTVQFLYRGQIRNVCTMLMCSSINAIEVQECMAA